MKNLHLLLPEETYDQLRTEAKRAKLPATAVAREAIDHWLKILQKRARHEAVAEYAARMGGSEFDLDRDFEAAGIEHLRNTIGAEK